MKWISSISANANAGKALDECIGKMKADEKSPPDIAFLFPTPHHALDYLRLQDQLIKETGAQHVLGCSGGGVIAGGKEIEHKPGLALLCAWLPDVRIEAFEIQQDALPSPDASPRAWRERLATTGKSPDFLILADPFTLDADALLRGLDYAYPDSVKIGGLASGAQSPGENALFLNSRLLRSGAVGLALSGDIRIDPIVAQGCRPIGVPLHVTACQNNLLEQLDGCRTLDVLEKLVGTLSVADRQLARTSLFLGVLSDPLKSGNSKRDFLIRNLVGLDPERGILAVGALLRNGQLVQFHLRDQKTAADDLNEHLSTYMKEGRLTRPEGALLFSCMGRGEHLYQTPDHDSKMFARKMGDLTLGGFFCNGEIGPVDGTTYLHGFTSSFAIIRRAETRH